MLESVFRRETILHRETDRKRNRSGMCIKRNNKTKKPTYRCKEVLKLKIAIVTGASSGMGREFVLQIPRLYKNLDELWVVARRTDRLKSLQEQVKIPVRIFDGDMQRNYIFEIIRR